MMKKNHQNKKENIVRKGKRKILKVKAPK